MKTMKDFPIVHETGPDAYAYCDHCGMEFHGEDVGRIPYQVRYADGEYGKCPFCKNEVLVDYDLGDDE